MKITWVDWNFVCLRKEVGGLGVRRIREFNMALLGKWCWRLLVEKESLWYRVLSAKYGEEGGTLLEGGMPLLGGVLLLPCGGSRGLVIMSVSRWGMGNKLIFGRMCGLVSCLLGRGLADYLSLRWTKGYLCLSCVSWGGRKMVRRGSGGGGCLRGKRRRQGTLFITSKC